MINFIKLLILNLLFVSILSCFFIKNDNPKVKTEVLKEAEPEFKKETASLSKKNTIKKVNVLPQKRIGDPITIQVGIINNPRFKSLTDKQINLILVEINKGVKERFNVSLKYIKTTNENIKKYFDRYVWQISKKQKNRIDANMFRNYEEYKYKSDDYEIFKDKIASILSEYMDLTTAQAAVKNQGYNPFEFGNTKEEIFGKVVDIHIAKLHRIANIKMKDGNNLIEKETLYNEFMFWDVLLELQSDYDLIITNQLIASAESHLPTIHSSLRGGITSGVATISNTPLHGSVVVSTFPFISKADFFTNARGSDYTDEEAINYIAWIGVHEFGHLLAFRPHYYDHPGCVMRPTPALKYKEWYKELMKSGKCNKEHSIILKEYYLGK